MSINKRKLSIAVIMPVRNCLKYTKQTYESFQTTKYKYEWIIIDNASDDGTQTWFQDLPAQNIHYIRNSENVGVAKSWNQGVQAAMVREHDLVFVINNDLVFAPDTFDNLMEWYGLQDENLFEFLSVNNVGTEASLLDTQTRKHEVIPRAQFIGFLTHVRTFRRIGWFDEEYKVGYFEDDDFRVRLQNEGIREVSCLDALVSHYGSRAIKEGGVEHEPYFTQNRMRFKEKWGFYPEVGSDIAERVSLHLPKKPKLLWICDACAPTGFSKITHNVATELLKGWDVHVLGINYRGDPHNYAFDIYPAAIGGDPVGRGRFPSIAKTVQPDLICAVNDPWVIAEYLNDKPKDIPFVAYMPVDGKNFSYAKALNDLTAAIFYTRFGLDEAHKGGLQIPSYIIPHGVDRRLYRQIDTQEARKTFGVGDVLPDDAFLFGNVNRNQPRKRLDLTLRYFKDWIDKYAPPPNVYLFLYCAQDDYGYDLKQLAAYFGLKDRVIIPDQTITVWEGIREEAMYYVYNSIDCQLSTTIGEGWGLTQMEGMACGVPQIAPDWAALGEWGKDAMRLIPCDNILVNPGNINTVGGIASKDLFIDAMQEVYLDAEYRKSLSEKSLQLVDNPDFTWTTIASMFHQVFKSLISNV